MRFLFIDQILEATPGNRLLATKAVAQSDDYLADHYPRHPLFPPTLVIECLAQAGGWLNLISRDFGVKTVLAVIENVQVHRHVQPGELLLLDVQMLYAHFDGATLRGQARIGTEPVMTVERLIFAHQWTSDLAFTGNKREEFALLSNGLQLPPLYAVAP